MEIIIIAAMAQNRIIGKNNKLPWHIPEELKLFKKTTMGCPMIMGRKTFESFPSPLPGRRHLVLSHNRDYLPTGGESASSMAEAIDMCGNADKVFIIGGAQIFAEGFELATTITLTLLERDFEGDVIFPDFSTDDFVEESRIAFPKSSEPFTVVTYRRK